MSRRILLIDDDPHLRDVVLYALQREGFAVEAAGDGQQGLDLFTRQGPFDLVVLDVMMPELDGLEVCRQLRRGSKVPIVFLSSRDEEIDKILGLELGGDDYVTKPFSVRELMLRVQAILRRTRTPQGEASQIFEFGVLRIDRAAHRVWVVGEEIELTALEFRLLTTLADRKNRVQTRAMLLDDVWGIKVDVATRTVDTHVKRLREKLGAAGEYVETVRGVGYRFAESPSAAQA